MRHPLHLSRGNGDHPTARDRAPLIGFEGHRQRRQSFGVDDGHAFAFGRVLLGGAFGDPSLSAGSGVPQSGAGLCRGREPPGQTAFRFLLRMGRPPGARGLSGCGAAHLGNRGETFLVHLPGSPARRRCIPAARTRVGAVGAQPVSNPRAKPLRVSAVHGQRQRVGTG